MSKQVLFINGSLRKESFNQTIIDYVQEKLVEKGYQTKQISFKDVPFFSQDIEFPAPTIVEEYRLDFEASQAVWIVSPEYNGSLPGSLKNGLDWMSRSLDITSYAPPAYIDSKLIAFSSAAGHSGGANVLRALTELATKMRMNPLEKTVGIHIGAGFQTGVLTLTDEDKSELDKQVELLVEALEK